MQNILTLETKKYAIKIDNFEGPLDLLCHLIDSNKMNICDVKISEITDQYIEYIETMKEMKLEIASEFLIMASTLVYLKSKTILPNDKEKDEELSEEELLNRIIEYKKFKEISIKLRELYDNNAIRYYKQSEVIELPKQELELKFTDSDIINTYIELIEKNKNKINENAKNIEKIDINETYTVASKVKEMLKELIKKPKFIFNSLFSIQECNKQEVVTAFSGLLELSRKNRVITRQENLFGDIEVTKEKKSA